MGVLLRNRPAAVGLLLGVLRADCCVVAVNSHLGLERVRADLATLDLPLLAGEESDVDAVVDADTASRAAVLSLRDLGGDSHLALGADAAAAAPTTRPGVAVRMLTSGTTGPPKRVDLGYDMFERVMQGAKHYESNQDSAVKLRGGVVIVNAPSSTSADLFRVLQAVLDGRRVALLERFTVESWADAVRRHQPKTVSLVPTALRMVLDADLDPADLASVRSVMSGTAPLDPDVADAFTDKYGIPVLTSYAATEFGGGVAGWNLADHREFGVAKRGSVGRAHAGCELRVVDQVTATVLGADEVGLLEVRASQLGGDEWIRTTDLARLDADGFLWIVGRADETILRGGMKVQPDVVRVALERDPAVQAAAVVGLDDARLGQVPVAAVELRDGSTTSPEELLEHAAPISPSTSCRSRSSWSTRSHARRRPRSSSPECARCSAGLAERGRRDRERWEFGESPLPDVEAFADAVRELASTVLALEQSSDELRRITAEVRTAQSRLAAQLPGDLAPRVGADVRPDQRVYVDHSRDIGSYNPAFPVYELTCADDRAEGTVEFPLIYEGPPGLVHGGFLAVFFDCVLQQLNCDLGLTGKTVTLALKYRRPTPLLTPLRVTASREIDGDRIRSHAQLLLGETVLCGPR